MVHNTSMVPGTIQVVSTIVMSCLVGFIFDILGALFHTKHYFIV